MLKNKRLLISEDEKKYILNLYNIILEQENTGNTQNEITKQVNFEDGFNSGFYLENQLNTTKLQQLYTDVKEVVDFLSNYPNNEIVVKIFAGEDVDPNWDNERTSEYGTFNKSIPTGELARRRGITMSRILQREFQKYIDEGKLKKMPTIILPTNDNGQLFVGTSSNQAQKTRDRFVRFQFSLKGTNQQTTNTPFENPCVSNMVIELSFDRQKGDGHNCNSAVYEIKLNGILLNRDNGNPYASLNNAGVLDDAGYTIKQNFRYSGKGKNAKKEVVVSRVSSNNPGGSRLNKFIVDDKILSQLRNTNESSLKLSITCRNAAYFKITDKSFPVDIPTLWVQRKNGKLLNGANITWTGTEWLDGSWGNGCHDKVGDVKITNANGETKPFNGTSPRKKDEEVVFVEFDPCSLKEINKVTQTQ
jgi:hypothetical protein